MRAPTLALHPPKAHLLQDRLPEPTHQRALLHTPLWPTFDRIHGSERYSRVLLVWHQSRPEVACTHCAWKAMPLFTLLSSLPAVETSLPLEWTNQRLDAMHQTSSQLVSWLRCHSIRRSNRDYQGQFAQLRRPACVGLMSSACAPPAPQN